VLTVTEQRQLLTAVQVAEILGKPVRAVQRMAKAGLIPATKLDGQTGAYVFDPDDVEPLRPAGGES
jgi:hypothetical protein